MSATNKSPNSIHEALSLALSRSLPIRLFSSRMLRNKMTPSKVGRGIATSSVSSIREGNFVLTLQTADLIPFGREIQQAAPFGKAVLELGVVCALVFARSTSRTTYKQVACLTLFVPLSRRDSPLDRRSSQAARLLPQPSSASPRGTPKESVEVVILRACRSQLKIMIILAKQLRSR